MKQFFAKRSIACLFTLIILGGITSCTDLPENDVTPPTPEPGEEFFTWESSHDLKIEVKVPATSDDFNNFYRRVQIFTDNSFEASALIASGAALPTQTFKTAVTVPTYVNSLYFTVKDAAGKIKTFKADVSSTMTNLTLDVATAEEYEVLSKSAVATPTPPDITIPSMDEMIVITESFPETITKGANYYIPKGTTITVSDPNVFGGVSKYNDRATASIYVEGTLNVANGATNGIFNKHIIVMDGGKFVTEKLYYVKYHYADEYAIPALYVMENGKVEAADFTLQNKMILVNKGVIECQTFTTNAHSQTHISGRLTASVKVNLWWPTSTSSVYLYPGSLLEGSATSWYGNAQITMYKDAIIYNAGSISYGDTCRFITPEGEATSLIRFDGVAGIPSAKASFIGPIEVFIPGIGGKPKAIEFFENTMSNGAKLVSSWETREYLIKNNGINKGYGEFTPVDLDGDGVIGGDDIDDTNPGVSFDNYYPSAEGFATVMFEDVWPYIGDYDMNDIVCDIRTEMKTNANNEVVSMTFKWRLRAAGTKSQIGMGVQLDDIYPADIKSVQYSRPVNGNTPFSLTNGLESGQEKAVFALFNTVEDVFGNIYVNTGHSGYITPKTESVEIVFNAPVSRGRLTEKKLNIFLTVNSREKEIHLPTYKMTNKGVKQNSEYLSADNIYLSNTGMMWGIMVPQSIVYPKEGINMEAVYGNYKTWYESNGTTNQDWYKRNINSGNAFIEPVEEDVIE